uniref:Peptidase U32 collagenase domain-containing protein n=1 Tax=Calcidiscus leptoporus TaxID=127549 RepID=A0A7S0JGU5_9EUKA
MEALQAARPKATVVATPRIIKPAEEALWRVLLTLEGADALLVRSAGLLVRLSELAEEEGAQLPRLHGDFSLNVANSDAARAFLALNLHRLAPTFDLDASQLCDLSAQLLPTERSRLEAVIHTNVPIFHTEHCVFARCLSKGDSYKDCGHPCTRHSLHLVDQEQRRHHVLADSGCRNTVFNAQPQSAAPYVSRLLKAGVRHLRVELTDQPGTVVGPLLQHYADLARGEKAVDEVMAWLNDNLVDSTGRQPGVTLGSFRPTAERAWDSLRPTAAEERANRRRGAFEHKDMRGFARPAQAKRKISRLTS